jgi:cell division protein FtsQ
VTTTRRPPRATRAGAADTPTPAEAGTPLDPRIRARRIAVRRQQGRRRLRLLLGLVLAAALVGLGFAAANSALLDVDQVAVRGNARTPTDEVIAASDLAPGQPLLLLDVDGASAAVERLAWVSTATVHRSITGTVTVEVVERDPVATLPVTGGGWVVVDEEGRQLERVDTPSPDQLLLGGVEATGVIGSPVGPGPQGVLDLLEALTPPVRAAVSGVGLDGEDLVLDLASGGRVRLGGTSNLDDKLVSLETMLARVDLRCLGELDLGVPSAPALSRRPPVDGDPQAPLADLSKCP